MRGPRFRGERGGKDAYSRWAGGGYPVPMPLEDLFSPTVLLWLVVSAMAVLILLGSINRRRARLTETLREYVDRQQPHEKQADKTNPSTSDE